MRYLHRGVPLIIREHTNNGMMHHQHHDDPPSCNNVKNNDRSYLASERSAQRPSSSSLSLKCLLLLYIVYTTLIYSWNGSESGNGNGIVMGVGGSCSHNPPDRDWFNITSFSYLVNTSHNYLLGGLFVLSGTQRALGVQRRIAAELALSHIREGEFDDTSPFYGKNFSLGLIANDTANDGPTGLGIAFSQMAGTWADATFSVCVVNSTRIHIP
jgi:hypothetical protein